MKKLVIGLIALVVIGAAGTFGLTQYSRARAQAEVEKAFEALRATGREASHGPVGFDLFSKTLTIPDIAIRSRDGASLKVASLIAAGISQPAGGRVAARAVEVNGLAIEVPETGTQAKTTYALPSLKIEEYTGPDTLLSVDGNGGHEVLRLVLRQLAAITATRVTAPEASAQINMAGTPALSSSASYTNLKAEGLAEGRIKTLAFDRMSFETSAPKDSPELALKGRLDGFSATDIDTAPVLALAERKAFKAGTTTVYGRMTASGYAIANGDGSTTTVGAVLAENLGIDPSVISLDRVDEMRALGQKGEALSEDEAKRLYQASADMLKGVAFTTFSLKDMAVTDPLGKAKVGAIALSGFKDGRLGTFAVEGLFAEASGQEPLTLDKLTLTGVTPLPIMEASAKAAPDSSFSSLDGILAIFRTLESIELSGLSAPREMPLVVKSFSLNWSQFIGLVPTRLTIKGNGITAPLSETDILPFAYLATAGVNQLTADLDLTLAYDPDTRTISLSPASTRVEKIGAATLDVKLTDVQRRAFEDPIAALAAAQQIGVGQAKLVVTNLGLADLLLKLNADIIGTTPEDLRAEVIAGIQQAAKDFAPLYPDATVLGEALAAFVKAPGTLTVTITPKTDVKVLDLIATDPLVSLQNFTITAVAAP